MGEVVVFDLEANLFFAVLSYGEVDLFGPRGTSFVSPCCGCSHLCEVGVVDLRGKFVFCSALLLVKSIFLTSRHKINFAVLFFLVKPVFWASRHELFSSLDVGVLIS